MLAMTQQVLEKIKNNEFVEIPKLGGGGVSYYFDPDTKTRYNLDGTVRNMETQ